MYEEYDRQGYTRGRQHIQGWFRLGSHHMLGHKSGRLEVEDLGLVYEPGRAVVVASCAVGRHPSLGDDR